MPHFRPTAPACALLVTLAVAVAFPALAHAEIRRCTRPDGGTVYTDRSCESLGAIEVRRPAVPDGGGLAPPRYRGGCARRRDDRVFEVGAAIDSGDTNRLARSYHWPGMSTRNGYAVIERLDAIARRPLVDVAPQYPQVVAPVATTPWGTTSAPAGAPPPPRSPSRPDSLRITQTLADGITPSTTVFGLRRHMDCWWITL